jgi:hypothetical protein
MSNDRTEVLIAGAGPTGLVLALWLAREGVAVRIVERTEAPGDGSRAMAVQARTLELYRQLGLADEVVDAGLRNPAINMWSRGKHRARLDLGDAGKPAQPLSLRADLSPGPPRAPADRAISKRPACASNTAPSCSASMPPSRPRAGAPARPGRRRTDLHGGLAGRLRRRPFHRAPAARHRLRGRHLLPDLLRGRRRGRGRCGQRRDPRCPSSTPISCC